MKKAVFETYKLKYPDTGLFHVTKELAAALAATQPEGWELEFFGRTEDRHLLPEGVSFRPIKWWNRYFLKARGADCVWHSPYQGSSYVPRNCKVLVTVHDLNFLYEKTGRKRMKRLLKLQHETDCADRLAAISKFSSEDLARNVDIKGKEVDVIYNGCNIYNGVETIPSVMPEGKFLFGVGTILEKKNWHVLPQLLVGNDLSLYIAGRLSPYADRIMEEARRCGVEDKVHLLSSVSEGEKHWYLSHCEGFVFPSLAEGFGLPVIEAMYHGRPVFISSHTSLREIGGDMAYFFPEDFNEDGMRRVLSEGLADFAANGNPEALHRYALSFSWTEAARRYWSVYLSM